MARTKGGGQSGEICIENSPRVTRGSVKGKGKQIATDDRSEPVSNVDQLCEVRTKYRNDPSLLAFKRSILGGEILKRKLSETQNKEAAGGSNVSEVRVVSPVAPAKKTRVDNHKLDVDRYKQLTVKAYEDYPSLFIRSTPCVLFKSLKRLNDDQKRAVKSLGFGNLLDFTIKEMPSKLDYWVLDNFHARRAEIELPSGKSIKVTEEDGIRTVFTKQWSQVRS